MLFSFLYVSVFFACLHFLPLVNTQEGRGGGGNSIVSHLCFLTHSSCQYDVTYKRARASSRLCKLARDTTVSWTSEVEEKLRVARA